MRKMYLSFATPVVFILCSCAGDQKSEEPPKDTLVVETPAEVPAVDTAAIIADYQARHTSTKTADKSLDYKTKSKKKVAVYTDNSLEVKALPNETADISGYEYKPDKKAAYPGGEKAFDKYFYRNFEYPQQALDNNIQGTIYAEIFTNEQGALDKINFPGKQLGYGVEDEARRVIM